MHRVVRAGVAVLVFVIGFFMTPVSADEGVCSNKGGFDSLENKAIKTGDLTSEAEDIVAAEDSIDEIEKTSASKDEEIERLQKLKEYYETNIRRLSRTAWRLEFKDPGYSRILDERVAQLQKKLDAVNKQLEKRGVKTS